MKLNKTYTLDTKIALKENTVKVTIETFVDVSSGIVGYFDSEQNTIQTIYATNPVYNSNTKSSDLVSSGTTIGKVYHDLGKIEFYFDFPVLMQGADNITVEYQTQDTLTTGINDVIAYGDNTLVCYDKSNQLVFFSDYANIDYFPLSNYYKMEVNCAYPIGDSTIALFTDKGVSYMNRIETTVGEKKKYYYSLMEGKHSISAIAGGSITTLANDVLFLARTGVHGLTFSTNVTSNERYALERSAYINERLIKHKDLSNARAITHNNRYYLAIDDVVYVADARYKTSPRDQDMNDTFNYEWWYWTNMPVREWFTYNDELYFVTKEGYIAKFTDERQDERILSLSYGELSNGLVSPVIDNYDRFQINMSYLDWLKEGNEIQQIIENSHTNRYVISDINRYQGTFKLRDYKTNEVLSNDLGLFVYGVEAVYLCDRTNVVSEWYTPILNMGTSVYSKNLIGSTLTFEPDVEGDVKFGYLTRRSSTPRDKESNLSSSEGVDFDNLDFTDFSFSVGFACSRTLKTRVRNYNYIQFRIVSDNNKDCALNNFVVTYTIGRKNKGVR
jgi:hypothetical protein